MDKSNFLLALSLVVEGVKGSCNRWADAVAIGIRAGFPITPNDPINENQILESILKFAGELSVAHTSAQALEVQAYAEAAWEYYQAWEAEVANTGGGGG